MRNPLTIVRLNDLFNAFTRKERDDVWLRGKELEVREGLRREAEKHGR